ncbi:2-succinyl-6-hydroxy-2,4-cyclohexadiene-1-carboxylate synthase [Aliifodinibius salicampi]|uniref:2-succinyl-6-hydroxy-2,4-cyclohexadiene-1-carboxylate synthase n=2 Tax=Fodinibius salicampi TaxID=1920655 RepID=A0ABT3PUU5_9BACT|nr:2-succinyl-6-hydroxy-2,4-cyclohexadiene-1-carboxylate synthase [Fodinibius salicampi]MCW9711624.1 2-succinyl-6-hydroxy-2,4-cyclohexadiene-1-carboxylate synthase [Fodinibius salicampi]
METIELNQQNYTYCIHQQKAGLPFLLMLHGFMGDHRVFNHLMDDLRSFCNPVTLDLLGYGESSKPASEYRYDEQHQIADIKAFINHLEVEKLYIHGYSMGGRLALKTALHTSGEFEGLILESTTCGITDPAKRKERIKTDNKRANQIETDFQHFISRWKELDLFKSPVSVNKSLMQEYHQIQLAQSPTSLAASLRGFGTGSMTPACSDIKQLDLPVLLIAGTADKKYQRINRYLEKQFPNTTFQSIKAGHRVHLDNPTQFADTINQFINKFTLD